MTSPPLPPSPPPAPIQAQIDDRDRFQALASGSLADVRAAAEKWRGGLAALVTLVTGGLLIKGPDAAGDLTSTWRLILSLLAGGGMLFAVIGLWEALQAAAGVPQQLQMRKMVEDHGSVLAWELAQAKRAASALLRARVALLIALPLFGAAVVAWWWSDKSPPSPPAYLEVEPTTGKPACGTLKSADDKVVVLDVAGQSAPALFRFGEIANIAVKSSC